MNPDPVDVFDCDEEDIDSYNEYLEEHEEDLRDFGFSFDDPEMDEYLEENYKNR